MDKDSLTSVPRLHVNIDELALHSTDVSYNDKVTVATFVHFVSMGRADSSETEHVAVVHQV